MLRSRTWPKRRGVWQNRHAASHPRRNSMGANRPMNAAKGG